MRQLACRHVPLSAWPREARVSAGPARRIIMDHLARIVNNNSAHICKTYYNMCTPENIVGLEPRPHIRPMNMCLKALADAISFVGLIGYNELMTENIKI